MVIVCLASGVDNVLESSQAGPPPHAKAWGKKYKKWKEMTPKGRKAIKAREKNKHHGPPPHAKAWGRKYKNWKDMTPKERKALKIKE